MNRRKVTKRRDLVRLLIDRGFREEPQTRTSHPRFRKGSRRVNVPRDWNGELPPGTVAHILREAGLSGEWRS